MRTLLLSTILLGLAAPAWSQEPPAHMGITPEEFKEIKAEMAQKKKEQEPLLKKLNDQAKKTADCRLDAVKLVTPTNVQAAIQTCDQEARAAIEKLSPSSNTSTSMVVSGTLVSGSLVSGTVPTVDGVSASFLVLPPVTSETTVSTTKPDAKKE